MVKSGQSIKVIQQEEIAFFLAEEGIVLLVNFDKQRFVIDYTLDQLEEKLDFKKFFRANRQLIVNIHAVARAEPYFKGRLLLQTEPAAPGDQVISSNKASAFKKLLTPRGNFYDSIPAFYCILKPVSLNKSKKTF
ncbi:LytR/AlgR family response regulator transcription factor [Salinimicrobium sediminilitoris]|uniref:LytR/AlgR family response regulator transcription factor n=1 Tax=Salinimicrobium sediminilitoris TaxID=2876715 RepID=UPI001E58A5D1|nr:LytTR family DNA-binding domain-containing protein [Salinimicrobium sediminilitoris]MCC8360633.1 LytTR family transcriptional regulator DNA-binding domain-containing protein [Salinimicrobium sediminilitoris]